MKLSLTPSDLSSGVSTSRKVRKSPNNISFNRATNFRSERGEVTLNPKSIKDTGNLIKDLPMWMDRACTRIFAYDKSGNIYQNDSGTWTKPFTASVSSGNGMAYYAEDGHLYVAQDKTIGRLLDACTGDVFTSGFLESEGGEATNTQSLSLNGTTQYASRADTASTSITGDLTIDGPYIQPSSLPSSGNTMTLVSKWDESGTTRSYKFAIGTVSNFFGDGSDGALTISSNTTEAPIDSSCTGTISTQTLTATNASFAADQKILIHQSRGTGAGTYQITEIQSYTAGTITTKDPLNATFTSGSQVRVLKQYTNVTINSGVNYTAKAWDGSVGGILAFLANGTVTITGNITATGKGYRKGAANVISGAVVTTNQVGNTGEGTDGASVSSQQTNNGTGGGGGSFDNRAEKYDGYGGGGGGYATIGQTPTGGSLPSKNGEGGDYHGSADLTTMEFGGAGGSGGASVENSGSATGGAGGNGGGIIAIWGKTIATITGTVTSNGNNGSAGSGNSGGGGGAGAGGSISIKGQTVDIGTSLVTATAGSGGAGGTNGTNGGNGSVGRINIDYLTSTTGTSSPTANETEDSTLGSSDGYDLRLYVSDDGDTSEILSQVANIGTGVWVRPQVTWDASASLATFSLDGVSIGTSTGTMTSIHDNASAFAVGCDFDSGGSAQNFFAGLVDDGRVFNDIRTATELQSNNDRVLVGTEPNEVAYYEFEGDLTDSQSSGNNDLTGTGSPTYSTDVPFIGLTSRTDQDQTGENNGAVAGTYTLTTAVTETAANRFTFVPTKDPQKSIILKIASVSTGNITVVVHDAKNRLIASSTVLVAQQTTGYYEFEYSSEWRPIIGATYHVHIYSTVADGTINVKTSETTLSDGSEQFAYFTTHFQILVDDQYHPMIHYQNLLVIGNERYVATLEGGDVYNPHRLTLPSGYRVRCIGRWREYIVFGMWRGTNITDYDQGKLVIWDGISDTYNQIIDVPEGGINTMYGSADTLFFFAGYTGKLMVYSGGLTAQKVQKIPFIEDSKYVEFAPGSMNMWRTFLTFGTNLLTDSAKIHQGVYTFGQENNGDPYSLSFDYPLSIGDQQSTNVKIGVVFPSGQDLYIGWQNSNSFGIDKVSVTNDPYPTGTIELLINDFGRLASEAEPLTAKVMFKPLNSGESVVLKYRVDRSDNWTTLGTQSTASTTEIRETINERARETELAFDLQTTVSTAPVIIGASIEVDTMEDERII